MSGLVAGCSVVRRPIPGPMPYLGSLVVLYPLLSHLLQVHGSLHLAVGRAYLKELRQKEREERRGYDLYGRLLRDRGGTLCSPYSAHISDNY